MIIHFLLNPRTVGALCSSSDRLSELITSNINIDNARNIVEIGPGYGAFTKKILNKRSVDSTFFALEINPSIARRLLNKVSDVEVEIDSAENLLAIMKKRKINYLDVAISGLPWSMFTVKEQDKLLDSIYDALGVGGYFATFAYVFPTPRAKIFKRKLFAKFSRVEVSEIIWNNIPPACIYYCQK